MARGNRRDVDRERAQKRAAKKPSTTSGNATTNLQAKQHTDAEIMRMMQVAAEERK